MITTQSKESITAACPICGKIATVARNLPSDYLRTALANCYGKSVPKEVPISDYRLMRCCACSFEFAWPMISGDASFYNWITKKPSYYPETRWEWGEMKSWLQMQQRPLRLLEVGSGSGLFLDLIRDVKQVDSIGLDPTISSMQQCAKKGLRVYAETLESYHQSHSYSQKTFDVIVAFHCLEHVENPKRVIQDMIQLLAPGGRIFVSTPYSPMSFEHAWFDPLNHPPHHVSRWNIASYTELARQCGLDMAFRMPKPNRLLSRWAESLNLANNGPQNRKSSRHVMLQAVLRPHVALAELFHQLSREHVCGAPAANVVLVELINRVR